MSRLDISDYIGMSIETVSRQLTSLKNKDVISLPSRHTAHIQKTGILAQSAGALT
jgi:CRP-like cAMP-binding protein